MLEETTYLIEFESGKRQKITVPSSWKVTFGPVSIRGASSNRSGSGLKMPVAIRFYENENRQRAIFTNVVSFRDTSILVEEERVDVQQKDGYLECDGKRKSVNFQAVSKSWVNPDKPAKELPQLPSDESIFDVQTDDLMSD